MSRKMSRGMSKGERQRRVHRYRRARASSPSFIGAKKRSAPKMGFSEMLATSASLTPLDSAVP